MFNSFTLIKNSFKSTYKMLIVFLLIIAMYASIIVTMFDPKFSSVIDEFSQMMPELMSMMGMNTMATTLTGFIASFLYGMIMILFPLIFIAMLCNKLIVKHIDSGSMSYLLTSSHSRKQVINSQISVILLNVLLLDIFATVICIAVSAISFPNQLDIGKFLMLNIGVIALHFLITFIILFVSLIFKDVKKGMIIGIGICVVSFMFKMLAEIGENSHFFKYFSFFSLFDNEAIVNGEQYAIIFVFIMLIVGLLLKYICSNIFDKKDLNL